MGQSALAAPSVCDNSLHPHAFTSAGEPPRSLRQQGGPGLALAGIAHDVRNLVTALGLCADLIAEPGVLQPGHEHFAQELRSITGTAALLARRLSSVARTTVRHVREDQSAPISDLPAAVQHLRGLLAAVAGPAVGVEIDCEPCAGTVQLSEESLTRILMNLVRNSADAMEGAGHIRITVEGRGSGNSPQAHAAGMGKVLLSLEDSGPGIPPELLERIFEPGFSTHRDIRPWPQAPHRGLGLSIVRQLAEEAGGRVRAVVPAEKGARFEIELPLTNVTPTLLSEPARFGDGGPQ